MTDSTIILASASPRRLELLQQIGIRATVQPAHIDETPFDDEAPATYVQRMAREKAQAIAAVYAEDALIIGADTSVILDQQILGKPHDYAHFRQLFDLLCGRIHEVMSAVSVCANGAYHTLMSTSRVHFRMLDEAELAAYWNTREPLDKAGGYAVQGLAALFIEKIEGSYSGIMGLPLYETAQLLQQAGVMLLDKGR